MNCQCLSHNGFLTERGYELAQRSPAAFETVDMFGDMCYLDKSVSVSALVEVEIDGEYDPNHTELNRRLIHNGS